MIGSALDALQWLADFGPPLALAGLGAVAVPLAWLSRFRPLVPRWLSEAGVALAVGVAAWGASWVMHTDDERLDAALRSAERLRGAIEEQARMAAEWQAVAVRQQDIAAARLTENQKLLEVVDDYEAALDDGETGADTCGDEPAYRRAMQSIAIGRPGAGED